MTRLATKTCARCGLTYLGWGVSTYCSLACDIYDHVIVDERGCWLWQKALYRNGYGQMKRGGKKLLAHRMAYMSFVGDPGDSEVCHRCDVRNCCNPAHLFLGTHAENVADMHAKGRQAHGEDHAHAKLTGAQVREIRAEASRPNLARDLAARYGVGRTTILRIRNGTRRRLD